MKRWGILAVCGLALLAGHAGAQDKLPPTLEGVGFDQRLNEQVPLDAPFRDEGGQTVRLGDYLGEKPVILVLAYYRCPRLCTEVLNGLADALRGLSFDVGKEFNVVTVSFDARERPPLAMVKKMNYLQQYGRPGAAQGWHFLTGEQASIDRLTTAVGFRYKYDAKHDQFAHDSGIMVLTPRGRIARYFFGIRYTARDLRLGLVEASENKISAPVDRALLWFCYHYDDVTGKYTVAVMNLVRLGGVLTLAALGTFLVVSWRRDWIKGRQAKQVAVSGEGRKAALTPNPSP